MREKFPDKKEALSLIDSSLRDFEFTLTLKATDESANTIIRNIYECFRMLGETLLISKGIVTSDHTEMIGEITKLNIKTSRPLIILDNLRRIRHRINYYAYRANKEEAENILNFAKSNYNLVYKEVKSIIDESRTM